MITASIIYAITCIILFSLAGKDEYGYYAACMTIPLVAYIAAWFFLVH